MAGGEGAKERRRLKRLAETTKDATPDKSQGKNSRDNKYTSTNRKDSSTRQQHGRNTTGNRFNKYDKKNNNNNKTKGNTKSNNTTPAKKKVKKPKHLKRKLEQASKENGKAVETIKKEMQDFEYKKGIIRNNSKRQRIDADDDGADTMFVVGPNTPGVFSRTKKADVEDAADTTMFVVGPNTPGVYGNNKKNAKIKSTNDDNDDEEDDDDIDMIDDKAETKSNDDSDSSADSSSDDDSSNEEEKNDAGESLKRKEKISNNDKNKKNAEIKSTVTKKAEVKPIKNAEIKPVKKAEIKPTNDDDKAETKSDKEEKKIESSESFQRKVKICNNKDVETSRKKGSEKEEIVASTVTDNEQDIGEKSISECIDADANVSEKGDEERPCDDDDSDDSDSDDSDSDDDSDDDNDEPQKRQRGRGRKGQQDTAKKIEETEAIEKVKTDNNNNNPSGVSTEKGKTRYCVGRKPVTDYTLGSSYPAEVVYVKPFGVFFDIGCHSDAFCHVSRLRDDFVESPESMFKEGDKVATVRVVEIDRRRKRITVSLQSESRVQDERKSIDARRTRTDSRKLKARKNEMRSQPKSATTDSSENRPVSRNPSSNEIPSVQKKDPAISIQRKEPVAYRAPAYAPTKTYNDPSMMAPADLKRARKLARRAERRSKAEA
ncbi:MAG: putative RNA-binding protein with RPS1 domain [Bacillariaceae sp.]|jgi:predicted RNA-binding protein with RPS1 domain